MKWWQLLIAVVAGVSVFTGGAFLIAWLLSGPAPKPCEAPKFRQISSAGSAVIGLDDNGDTWRWQGDSDMKCWVPISQPSKSLDQNTK